MMSTINGGLKKCMSVVLLLVIALTCLSGCSSAKVRNVRVLTDSKLYRYVVPRKESSVTEESLGEINTDGEFTKVDPDNMLKFEGYYKGMDYVTLVFSGDSPIGHENVKLNITEDIFTNALLDGILYQLKDGKKYVTFKFETGYHDGTSVKYDTAKGTYFRFPTKEGEPQSFYSVNIKCRDWSDKQDERDISVAESIQTEVLDRGYYTDYRYDFKVQYYDIETDTWTAEPLEEKITDNMPLE